MNQKVTIIILAMALIFLSFCKKDVKTIPDYLRKGTAEYHTNNGYKNMNHGALDVAGEEFRKALKKKPLMMKANMGLGIVYLKQMKFDKSLALFRKVAKRQPDNADAFNFMGVIHSEKGNYKLAKENFLIAAHSKTYATPENAYLNLALLEAKAKNPDSALRYIEKGLVENPEFVSLYNLRGTIYEKKGFYKKAVYNYERALHLSRVEDIGIRINIARGYIKMGKRRQALNLLEKMMGEAPSLEVRKIITSMIRQAEGK